MLFFNLIYYIYMFNPRTLSGVNSDTIEQLNLPSTIDAILIDGNPGERGQVIAKNNITNKLEWDEVDDITIPDNSISGDKLKTDITFTTTGLIRANQFFSNAFNYPQNGAIEISINSSGINMTGAGQNIITVGNITGAINTSTNKFIQTGTAENTFNGQLRLPAITTLNSGDGLTTLNGGNIELFSDAGNTKKLEMDGSNGNITSSGLISGSSITTAGNITATGTIGFVGVGTDADTYKILLDKNGTITCNDLEVNNHDGSITFNDLVCNDLECKTFEILNPSGGGFTFQLTNNIMSFSGAYTINGASANATLKSLILSGGLNAGVDTFVIAGSTDTTSDTSGNLGSITMNTGDLDVKTGTGIFRGGVDFLGNNPIDFKNSSDELIIRISPDSKEIDIDGLYLSEKVGTGTPPTDNTYTDWALNLNGAGNTGHGHISGNLIVDGVIYGSIVGSITEEHIDAESLVLRENPNGASTPQGLIIEDGFKILGYTGNQSSTNRIDINCSTGLIRHGGIQQTTNTIGNSFSASTLFSGRTTFQDNSIYSTNFHTTWYDDNTASNSNGVRACLIDGDGVKMYPANDGAERLRIDRDGSIDFKSTIGDINGFSSSTPNGFTNMTMFDQSNQLPYPLFVQICDPSVHSVYSFGGGVWYNLAGYTANNPAKPRFTNADLSFTAFGTTARVNLIFSASVNNNMGVRIKEISVNGTATGNVFTGTQRLMIGSSAHRGQHEYTMYITGLTIGYNYVIAPEVFITGSASNSITIYVGSNSGSATLQNADLPIILEVGFFNRATINTGNIYEPSNK